MKLLSIVVFTLALVWTWNVIHSTPNVTFETHTGIQEKLADIITQNLKHKKPEASDIQVEQVWTEVIGKDKLKAHFVYSFKDASNGNSVRSQIFGEGILEKQTTTGSANSATANAGTDSKDETKEHWQLSNIKANSDVMVFEEGLVVTPGDEPAADESTTTTDAMNTDSEKENKSTEGSGKTGHSIEPNDPNSVYQKMQEQKKLPTGTIKK